MRKWIGLAGGGAAASAALAAWTVTHHTSEVVARWSAPEITPRREGRLAVRRYGTRGFRPTIVLLHGLGTTGRYFGEAPIGSADTHVLVPDLLGFGASRDFGDETFGLEQHTRAVIETIDACIGTREPIAIAAHSMGSAVALAVARELGSRVERTVVCGAPMYAPDDDVLVDRKEHDAVIGFLLRHGDNARWLIEQNERRPDLMGRIWALFGPSLPFDLARDASRHTWESLRQSVRELVLDVDWDGLVDLRTPTISLHGSADGLGNRAFIESLSDRAESFEMREISGAGHHLPITHRADVAAALAVSHASG